MLITDFVEQHDVCIIGAYDEKDYELIKQAHDPLPQNYAHWPAVTLLKTFLPRRCIRPRQKQRRRL